MIDLARITGFDWDDGNARKNRKHGVVPAEAEEVFFNQPLLMLEDLRHRNQEARYPGDLGARYAPKGKERP